jgi:hypothetical protein
MLAVLAGEVALPGMLLHLEFVPSVGRVNQHALAVPGRAAVEDFDRSAQHDCGGLNSAGEITQRQMVDHDLAIGQVDERLLRSVLADHEVVSFLRSHRNQEVDARRVSREPAAIRPHAGDLDMNIGEMTRFLLL